MKLFLAATLAVTSLSLYAAAPEKAEWKLVWSDEVSINGHGMKTTPSTSATAQ